MHVRATLKYSINTALVRNLTTSSFTAGTGHLGNAHLSLWEDRSMQARALCPLLPVAWPWQPEDAAGGC